MKKKIYIISLIVIVGLLIRGTTYYYLQSSPTNYNQTKHQAQKSLQTAMIMRTDVSIKEADNLIDKLSTKDRR
ncbi:YdgA family protein, partial [Lactococcus lactis]